MTEIPLQVTDTKIDTALTLLKEQFDSVVMLTWSNWHTERVSNRFHYATRFSKHWPVIFVQQNILEKGYYFEEIEKYPNITILNIYYGYSELDLAKNLNQALSEKGYIQPILWMYNFRNFSNYYINHHSRLKIYHATEDYFHPFFIECSLEFDIDKLKLCLEDTHLLISVSDEVEKDYICQGNYNGASLIAENGCDYDFYAPSQHELNTLTVDSTPFKKILFQGGIRHVIDFSLLVDIITQMPDYEFWFCGDLQKNCESEWAQILKMPNVKYFGQVNTEKIRELSYKADIGIIPYIQDEIITRVSFPLKAFEYLACGLPVVSIPIQGLKKYSEYFYLAETTSEFIQQIKIAAKTRRDPMAIHQRLSIAKLKTYDLNFENVLIAMAQNTQKRMEHANSINNEKSYNILMLYDDRSTHVQTIREYLEAFGQYSQHQFTYLSATGDRQCEIDLSYFDAVMLHYSIRVCFNGHLSSDFESCIRQYGGLKILFIQDDYDYTEIARSRIEYLGIHLVFTSVPDEFINIIYPKSRFSHTLFKNVLTGYIPKSLLEKKTFIPLKARPYHIVYRGRCLPFSYGSLCYEKYDIGVQMKRICLERNIPADIEVDDDKRIYGPQWYNFMESGRATLGTETGTNLFDFDGKVTEAIKKMKMENPDLKFEDVYEEWVKPYETLTDIHELSPKIFEAIAHKTALILFEGKYSGILQPHKHYIPLKKDYSNINQVLNLIEDLDYLEAMAERTYKDILCTEEYTYKAFVKTIDEYINRFLSKKSFQPVYGLIGFEVPQLYVREPYFDNTFNQPLQKLRFEQKEYFTILDNSKRLLGNTNRRLEYNVEFDKIYKNHCDYVLLKHKPFKFISAKLKAEFKRFKNHIK